jgi:hypothetical protein
MPWLPRLQGGSTTRRGGDALVPLAKTVSRRVHRTVTTLLLLLLLLLLPLLLRPLLQV